MIHQVSTKLLKTLLIAAASIAALEGCSKSDTTTAVTTTTDEKLESILKEGAAEVNALAAAYPGSLAISIFPSETSTGLRLADASATTPPEADRPPEERQKEAEERMKGEGDCFDPRQLAEFKSRFDAVTCYQFDSDMEPFRQSNQTTDQYGTLNGYDKDGTQACLVTYTKAEVDEVIHMVDRSLALVQGLICVEKKVATAEARDVRTPTVDGDAISMTEAINAKLPANAPIKFTTADISVVTNPDGGLTYVTEIAVTNPFGKTDSVVLRHTPATTDSTTESGILSFVRAPMGDKAPAGGPVNDPNSPADKYDVLTIKYTKTTAESVDNMSAELTHAMINKKYEPLDDDGLINFAAVPSTAQNSDIHDIKYVAFDVVPTTGEGSISYWKNPGGNLVESARGLVFNLTADADTGLLSGCGTTGATSDVSIRAAAADSTKVLTPTRYWHPMFGQNASTNKNSAYTASEGAFVTRQCVKQVDSYYVIDTSKTTDTTHGYDVIKGTDSTVRVPQRPPEANLPPPPPLPKG